MDGDAVTLALIALALVVVLALAGGTLRARGHGLSGSLSLRSVLRYLCGRRARDRHTHDDQSP